MHTHTYTTCTTCANKRTHSRQLMLLHIFLLLLLFHSEHTLFHRTMMCLLCLRAKCNAEHSIELKEQLKLEATGKYHSRFAFVRLLCCYAYYVHLISIHLACMRRKDFVVIVQNVHFVGVQGAELTELFLRVNKNKWIIRRCSHFLS